MKRKEIPAMTGERHFMKWHGAGNDFVVIDSRQEAMALVTPSLAQRLGDRHRGVGFDQLAELRPTTQADFQLDFWNSDGTMAEACGNATRCVSDYVMGQTAKDHVTLLTRRGVLTARRSKGGLVSVNMGAPQLNWDQIPLSGAVDHLHLPLPMDPVGVGMGNPHCVIFVPDATKIDLGEMGPKYEHDPLFPARTNVEFASLMSQDRLRMRVWERGAGVTLACGSGACATAVAAHLRGLTGRKVSLELDGGVLDIDWRDDGVWMTGPTAHVFDGTLTADFLAAHQ